MNKIITTLTIFMALFTNFEEKRAEFITTDYSILNYYEFDTKSNHNDIEKVLTYNSKSGNTLKSVAFPAINHSKTLIDCRDIEKCEPTKILIPTAIPTVTPSPYQVAVSITPIAIPDIPVSSKPKCPPPQCLQLPEPGNSKIGIMPCRNIDSQELRDEIICPQY
jgi:hypothetical protein